MGTTDGTYADEDDPRVILLREHDRLAGLLMKQVDFFQASEQLGKHVNFPHLRQALGPKLRESIAARDAALLELGLEARTRPDLRVID